MEEQSFDFYSFLDTLKYEREQIGYKKSRRYQYVNINEIKKFIFTKLYIDKCQKISTTEIREYLSTLRKKEFLLMLRLSG